MVESTSGNTALLWERGSKTLAEVMETVILIESFGKDLRKQDKNFDLCMNANMLGSVTLSSGKVDKAGTFLKKGF